MDERIDGRPRCPPAKAAVQAPVSASERRCGSIDPMYLRRWSLRDPDNGYAERVAFGAWVYEARRQLGCSQARLGEIVGLHQSTISRLERGLVPYLYFQTVLRLVLTILDALAVRRPNGG
jgi:DNA-binding XRE family transcriptional regulator